MSADGRVDRLQAVALAAQDLLALLRGQYLVPRSVRAGITDALVALEPGDLPEKTPPAEEM